MLIDLIDILAWPLVVIFLVLVARAFYKDRCEENKRIFEAVETVQGFLEAKKRIESLEQELAEVQMKLNAILLKSGMGFN